jgi:hypothetical protein
MDENSARDEQGEATPIFGAYRRGYDPDQVDRYVAEQQRRLDETTHRATESERKLAAAVGQLRELHRRVAALENEERPQPQPQPQQQPLDTLGERVQRIMQEAWDGAYAVRETAEREIGEQRQKALEEAKDLVASARRKAQAIEEEIDRRRRAYLERLEEDRARAAAQIERLHTQRALALEELARVRDVIDDAIGEVDTAPEFTAPPEREVTPPRAEEPAAPMSPLSEDEADFDDDLPPTMPVHRLEGIGTPVPANDRADLVRSHRQNVRFTPAQQLQTPQGEPTRTILGRTQATVFDFDKA